MLDDALPPVAARQVEIDVGPFAALCRQKPLEQEIHPDRIDGGDAEAVAHRAVGGRSAALHQDVVLAAEVHDVPDDQKIAGEIERLDEIELARDLGAGPVVIRPVAIARADLRHLAEKRRLGFAGRHGIGGKAVAEIGHRELKPIGQFRRSRDRVRTIREQRRHGVARLQVPLGIRRQPPAGMREIGVMVDARQDVEQRPLGWRREADAAGGDDRHPERRGHRGKRLVVGLLVAAGMPLQLDVRAIAAEETDEAIEQAADAEAARVERRAARQRDEAGGEAVELLERERALAFRRAQFHAGDEAAEIPIALLVLAEDGKQRTAGKAGRLVVSSCGFLTSS